jgi:hypothetical protein
MTLVVAVERVQRSAGRARLPAQALQQVDDLRLVVTAVEPIARLHHDQLLARPAVIGPERASQAQSRAGSGHVTVQITYGDDPLSSRKAEGSGSGSGSRTALRARRASISEKKQLVKLGTSRLFRLRPADGAWQQACAADEGRAECGRHQWKRKPRASDGRATALLARFRSTRGCSRRGPRCSLVALVERSPRAAAILLGAVGSGPCS